jgi:O-antigen/teichoic acid export membrane protein
MVDGMRVIAAFLVNTLCNFAIGLLVAKFLGPEEFGRFALALAVGVVLQTGLFEWIRLSSVRFYSERSRVEQPDLRSTLDLSFAAVAAVPTFVATAAMLVGFQFPMSNALIGLAVAASITNGLFDYNTAMVRARFDDALYGKLIMTKNLVALFVTAGGAYAFHSATVAVLGVCVSMAGSVMIFRKKLSDSGAGPGLAHIGIARRCLSYAAPIVVANLLYLAVPFANRALSARWYGYAETGQFALAYDIGTRVVAAIGSALDVLLFQLAVRADEQHGVEHGRDQVTRNMATIFAIVIPACAGVWLTLPSIERLVVPEAFRGPFREYFELLLPGQCAFGLLCFALSPVFLIVKRTTPMIFAAFCACVADASLLAYLPHEPINIAIAQSGAMIVGMAALLGAVFFTDTKYPPARDILTTIVGAAAMILAVTPLRAAEPGVLTLLAEMSAGILVYGAFVAFFDIAGLRGVAFDTLRKVRAKVA